MFPQQIKKSKVSSTMKPARQQLVDKFQNGKVIRLKETEFKENKFRLIKSINFLNPFVTKIMLSDIKGQIDGNNIYCEIGLSLSMKAIVYIDSLILLFISLGLFFSSKYEGGLATLIFLVIIISFTYFRLKYEIRILISYLDDAFLKQTE